MLVKGTRLLGELLPKLARSALNHLHLVAVVTSPLQVTSVTNPSIPGAAFFSPLVLKHPWRAAEFLLHEALHLKFIDLEHTHSMLRRGYAAEGSPRIRAVWNRSQPDGSNEWPANRVLTVLHVYTSLALFFRAVELRVQEIGERYGSLYDLNPGVAACRALDRAYYLALNVKDVRQELGLAGERFADWLLGLLEALDPRTRSAHLNAHLLLDLYERETEQITRVIAGASLLELRSKAKYSNFAGASLQQVIGDLVQSEVASTDRLLSDIGGGISPFAGTDDECQVLSTAMGNATPAEIAAKFCSVRSLISLSLRKAVAKAHEPVLQAEYLIRIEQHVGAMVEHSATHIKALNERGRHRDPD
ncbi:MAG: HEXXH motif-containing putative peptide modification protein [Pseudomonadota bacterium]|nr:HEXXH motif-containing putative peptide modification protein [Pseudomonadota bacterium]